MTKKVAIIQSNYIPWKGYFDIINLVDEFILYDDAQYTRRDWRNRNQIKGAQGLQWLTIPVQVKDRYTQRVCDVEVADKGWPGGHWLTILHNYARAPYFEQNRAALEPLFLECEEARLSDINYRFIRALCDLLGIRTKLSRSMAYTLRSDDRTGKLVELCEQAGATEYVSGPSAAAYMDEAQFHERGMKVSYMDYSGYPEYRQLFPPFRHEVTILDLILNEGPNATRYMKTFGWSEASHPE
jgi:hypothetical protein